MNLVRILVSLLLVFSAGLSAHSQSPQPSILQFPEMIQPPADAAALGKYGDIPVSMDNGSAEINVPIYDIKTPRLTLPIALNYNSTGIKVDDIASWVGLEWSLNAGGVITRSIQGVDDFLNPGGYYYSTIPLASNVSATNSWKLFQNVMDKNWDSEPDYFFFNFGPYAGKFFFGQDKKPVIVNYQKPLQVNYVPASGIFTIQDEKGNTYYFGALETNGSGGSYNGPYKVNNYTTSWYLSKIVSYDLSDSITFTYKGDPQLEQDFQAFSEVVGPYFTTAGTQVVSGHDYGTDEPFRISNPLRLQEIDYKNGKTKFFSSQTRSDGASSKLDSVIVYFYDYSSKQFKEIKKVKPSYSYYTSTSLVGTKPTVCPGPYRLRLDSVRMYGADSLYAGAYKFTYDPNMLPWIASNGRDQFGYYNGAYSNTTLVPSQTVTFATTVYNVGNANRSTNASTIQNGILKSITYPTGGYTNFTYEPNSYSVTGAWVTLTPASANAFGVTHQLDTSVFVAASGVQSQPLIYVNITSYNYPGVPNPPFVKITDLTVGGTVFILGLPDPNNGAHTVALFPNWSAGHTYQCVAGAYGDSRISAQIYVSYQQISGTVTTAQGGGLRIKQVSDYDYTNRFLKSDVYTYGLNESGYGELSEPTNLFNTTSYTSTFGYMSPINNTVLPFYTTTRMIFTGEAVYDAFTLAGAPVTYPQVTKYHVDSVSNNIGKSVYNFNYYNDNILAVSIAYLDGIYLASSGWQGGQLLKSQDYAYKSGVYWPVKRATYSYLNPPGPQGRGLKLGYQYVYPVSPPMDSLSESGGVFAAMYYWFDAPIYAGSVLPLTETVQDYDQNDTTKFVTTTKQYTYDNLVHLQPTRITSSESDGSTLLTINRYPAEMDSLAGLSAGEMNAIDTLASRHDLTALLQTTNYLNNSLVSNIKHHYSLWNTNMALPSSVEVQNGSFASETRLQMLNYDAQGNLLQLAKAPGTKMNYLWDYNNAFPIAEVRNAPNSDIAYTSFEADGTGGWTVPDTTRQRTSAITGQLSYNLSGKIISKSLTTGTAHILSYWSSNGALTVTQSGVTVPLTLTGLKKGGWTYYEHLVPSTATALSITTASGSVDELRLYPQTALMSTYTYQPLAGMTTATSPANIITHYQFDGLARIKIVRDIDSNVVKEYDYQYQSGAHTYYSTATTATATRNNCTSCQVGSQVTYLVPANAYLSHISQADANQQAINYANSQAQAYANANGTCSAAPIGPITATNSTSLSITVGFTNNCTGSYYQFTLGNSTGTNWNTVPTGTYTISVGGGLSTTTYNANGYIQTGTTPSFSNVPIVTGYNNFWVY